MKVYAIIPSGGIGKRINNSLPKQYIKFRGKELIAYTIDIFQKCDLIDEIIVPAQKEFFNLLEEIKQRYSFTKITNIVEGGQERQHSVINALKSIAADDIDLIVVHDAVRPLLPQNVLKNVIETADSSGAAVVALKAKDTLIRGNDKILSYADWKEYYYVQTPQVFRYGILLNAMQKADSENFIGTDESMLVHHTGFDIKIVVGSSFNFKVTDQDDIKLFDFITRLL